MPLVADRNSSRYSLVEKHLIEYSTVAMQRPDFKKTDDMFNRVLGKDHIAVVCLLENKETGTRLIVANTHLHWDPAFSDVKLVQTALLIEEVEKVAQKLAKYPLYALLLPLQPRLRHFSPPGVLAFRAVERGLGAELLHAVSLRTQTALVSKNMPFMINARSRFTFMKIPPLF